MKSLFLTTLLFFSFSVFAQNQESVILNNLGIEVSEGVPTGLKKGEKAPNFTTYDQSGKEVELYSLLKKGKVLLNFYRGEWCPVCVRYMSAFNDSMEALMDKGISVVSVSPETNRGVQAFMEKTNSEHIIIADTDNSIMKDYEVLFSVTEKYQKKIDTFLHVDIATHNQKEAALLPVPATYLINEDGTIIYVHFDPNYKERASVEDILKGLESYDLDSVQSIKN